MPILGSSCVLRPSLCYVLSMLYLNMCFSCSPRCVTAPMSPHLPIVRLLSPSPPCRSYTDTSPPSRAFGALPRPLLLLCVILSFPCLEFRSVRPPVIPMIGTQTPFVSNSCLSRTVSVILQSPQNRTPTHPSSSLPSPKFPFSRLFSRFTGVAAGLL